MKPYAEISREAFPLVTVTFTGEKATAENFGNYLYGLFLNYERQESFAIVFDFEKGDVLNKKLQKEQAEWIQSHERIIKKYCKGVAYVAPSLVTRSLLRVMLSFQESVVPYQIFSKMEDGKNWAKTIIN